MAAHGDRTAIAAITDLNDQPSSYGGTTVSEHETSQILEVLVKLQTDGSTQLHLYHSTVIARQTPANHKPTVKYTVERCRQTTLQIMIVH